MPEPHAESSLARRPGRPGWCPLAALAGALGAAPAGVAQPVYAVRNLEPQRTVAPVNEQWPIYYPRLAHLPGDDGEDLLAALLDLHTAMRFEQASEIAVQIVEIDPKRPEAHYNLACVLARLHRHDDALSALDEAVARGWRDRAHLVLDPDLEVIRTDTRFEALLGRIETLLAEQRVKGPASAVEPGTAPAEPARPVATEPRSAPKRLTPPPVFLLVSEWPERLDAAARPAAGGVPRLVTLALSPPLARRLRAWLAEAETTAPAPAQTPQ